MSWDTLQFKKGDKVRETFIVDSVSYTVADIRGQIIVTECGRKFARHWLRYDHKNRKNWFKD